MGEHGPSDRLAFPADRLGRFARGVGIDLNDIVLTDPVALSLQVPNAFPELVDSLGR